MGFCYIYLHEWLILMVNVGKYTSPMDPRGCCSRNHKATSQMLPRRPSIGDVAILPVEEAGLFKQQVMGEIFFCVSDW